jgi:hypothetical protein
MPEFSYQSWNSFFCARCNFVSKQNITSTYKYAGKYLRSLPPCSCYIYRLYSCEWCQYLALNYVRHDQFHKLVWTYEFFIGGGLAWFSSRLQDEMLLRLTFCAFRLNISCIGTRLTLKYSKTNCFFSAEQNCLLFRISYMFRSTTTINGPTHQL